MTTNGMPVRQQIPNIITLLRMALIVPLCQLLWREAYTPALVLLVIGGLSDALDGFLARRNNWHTPLGAWLDPVADKLFILSITILFGLKGYLPWWLVWLVLARDVLIVGGALVYHWVKGALEMKPLFISKLNTTLQITLLALTLLHVGYYSLPVIVTQGLQWLVAVTTILSGAGYVYLWSSYALGKGETV